MRLTCWLLVLCAIGTRAVADDALVVRSWEAPRKLPAIAAPPPAFEPDQTLSLAAAALAEGRGERALAILDEAPPRDADPERACRARVMTLRATLLAGDTRDKLAAVRALAAAARGTAGACRTEADALIGDLAWAYHNEASGCIAFADPRVIARDLWALEIPLATTGDRRATAARNRALILWVLAQNGDGRDPDAWAAAALAADVAAALDPADLAIARRAADARHNRRAVMR